MDPNFHASSGGAAQGMLPDITFTLERTDFLTGTFTLTDTDGNPVDLSRVTVQIKDENGNTVPLSADGTFPALAGEYTYTVTSDGYETAEGSFTVTADGETVSVVLMPIPVEPEPTITVWRKIVLILRAVRQWLKQPGRRLKALWQTILEILKM